MVFPFDDALFEVLSTFSQVSFYLSEEEFQLISPEQLDQNDAFMLFFCLKLILEDRDYITKQKINRNDIQMYLDSMVGKHDVQSVLKEDRSSIHWLHIYSN